MKTCLTRLFLALALALTLGLTGCVTYPNALDPATRTNIAVKEVTVVWPATYGSTPAARDVKGTKEFEDSLKAAVLYEFATSPAGSQAVRFQLEINDYVRANAVQDNIHGLSSSVRANVKVIRLSDQKELGVYPRVRGEWAMGSGIFGAVFQLATGTKVDLLMARDFSVKLRKRFNGK
jgi:hypothetical protein